jgi:hypothetical protein
MRVSPQDFIAVHHEPAWREYADFIFHAHIGIENGKNEWEQLWGRQTERNGVILCCIPFYAYDLSLGDELLLENGIVSSVLVRSNQMTFRIYLSKAGLIVHNEILRVLGEMNSTVERSSENFFAVSIESGKAQSLADYLQTSERQGLMEYETGQSV